MPLSSLPLWNGGFERVCGLRCMLRGCLLQCQVSASVSNSSGFCNQSDVKVFCIVTGSTIPLLTVIYAERMSSPFSCMFTTSRIRSLHSLIAITQCIHTRYLLQLLSRWFTLLTFCVKSDRTRLINTHTNEGRTPKSQIAFGV